MSITENIDKVRKGLREGTTLVVVSKTRSIAEIQEAYAAGVRDFGENKVQELMKKAPLLPSDIRWHLIGHLQSNKVKQLIPATYLIHSIDSFKLLREVNAEAGNAGKTVNCLLQFHIAKELSKFGLQRSDIKESEIRKDLAQLQHVNIIGVMGMATFTDDEGVIRSEFREMKSIFAWLKTEFFAGNSEFREISMGMSDDYSIAVEEGSTIVRVGTAIFGSRQL